MLKTGGSPRLVINSLILLGFALVSHTFAGGSFTNIARLFAMLVLIVCALFILGRSVLSGPRLALLVLIVQSSTHLVLGGINSGGIVMSASHIIGGFASFVLLTKSDEFWFTLRNFVFVIFLPFKSFLPDTKKLAISAICHEAKCWSSALVTSSHGLRAPPLILRTGIFA